jgi:hypothetical protein
MAASYSAPTLFSQVGYPIVAELSLGAPGLCD